ncbi:MAG: tripartite tricarboxylate transporter TctB family protein [Castellaniella sp.]
MVNHERTGIIRHLLPPMLFIVAVPVLLRYLAPDIGQADAMARGLAGPVSWPRFALYGVLFCAVGWLIQSLRQMRREAQTWRLGQPAASDDETMEPEQDEAFNEPLIWSGVALTLAYGFLIPVVGFALATMAYLLFWLLLGGIRKPVLITGITVLGTVLLLYVFVKLALMPLDRGQGMFDGITVSLYRLLRIY